MASDRNVSSYIKVFSWHCADAIVKMNVIKKKMDELDAEDKKLAEYLHNRWVLTLGMKHQRRSAIHRMTEKFVKQMEEKNSAT